MGAEGGGAMTHLYTGEFEIHIRQQLINYY